MEFLHLNAKQYRDMLAGKFVPKSNKYHAKKTESDGIVFDSNKEMRRWKELCVMESSGLINNLQRQVRFILQEGFVANDGKKVRPISYLADFCYCDKQGNKYIEDCKSVATKKIEVYRLKKKMVMYKYPEYKFVES